MPDPTSDYHVIIKLQAQLNWDQVAMFVYITNHELYDDIKNIDGLYLIMFILLGNQVVKGLYYNLTSG